MSFEGIKDPDRRVTHKMYDLHNGDNDVFNAETWDAVVGPGSTITMQFRTPPVRSMISADKASKIKAIDKTQQKGSTMQPPQSRVEPQQLGKKNKSIKRQKLKERARKAAKAKATVAQPFVEHVDTGRRLRRRTFIRNGLKEQKASQEITHSQPTNAAGVDDWNFHPEQHFIPRTLR